MANFTDTIPQFNPYVQQLPVEAMLKVGMQKQQQYNTGIEKIQANIDKISGLDVGREVDKAYLQSKINEVGNSLQSFMAADFSDSQLVNSAAGVTSTVSSDPYVKAAVYSTANDRKQTEEMEKDRQKGTLTPQSEYFYQLKRNKYYNNPNLKTDTGGTISFNDKYIPSWDIDKNILEAVKAVGDSKWTADNVFKMDGNGNILKDRNGAPVYSEYAIREMRAGKFSENITAAIDSVLVRPEAKQELNMRGIYNYRGYSNIDDFVHNYEQQKQRGLVLLDEKKLNLLSKITTETDPAKIKEYQALINKTDGEIASLTESSDLRINEAEGYGSVDSYKAALETQKIRNDYQKAYTTEQYSKEYIESIPYKVAQEKIKSERDWWKAQDDSKRGWFNSDTNRMNALTAKDKWDNDPKNPNRKKLEEGDMGEFIAQPVSPHELYGDFMTKGAELDAKMTTDKRNFVAEYLKAITFGNGKSITDEEVNKSIDKYMKKDSSFIDRYYEKGKKDVTDHPDNTYFSNLSTAVPGLLKTEKDLHFHSQQVNDINKDATVIAAGGKEVDFTNIEKNLKTYKADFSIQNGEFNWFGPSTESKTITPKDIVNFAIVNSNPLGMGSSSSPKGIFYTNAMKELEAKYGKREDFGSDFSKFVKNNPEFAKQYSNVVSTIRSKKYYDVLNAKEAVLKEKSLGNASVVTGVYAKDAKEAEIKSSKDRMNVVLNTFKEGDIDVSEFKSLMEGKKEFSPNIKIDREKGTYNLALYDGEQLVKEVPITKRQMDYIKDENVQVPSLVSDVQRQISWSGKQATSNINKADPGNPSAYESAYYPSTYFFKNFNRTDVLGADIKVNGEGQPNLYFYIKSGGVVKGVPLKMNTGDIYPYGFDSVDQAEAYLRTLSTSGQIDNIINNSKPKAKQ